MSMSSSSSPRLLFLDWLRIGGFALLVLYHVGMYYVSWEWHIKSPDASPWLEPLMRLSSPWRLSLLFFVSGVAVSTMLARPQGAAGFAAQRSKRLLLPLLFGMLVVVPPQAYLEVVHRFGYAGSYADFMGLYLVAYDGFCRDGRCLILPTWNHLWFVPYLWLYTMLLWAALRRWPELLDAGGRALQEVLHGWRLLVLPVALLALLRVALAARFPSTHALVDDWFNHAQYASVFMLGALFARGTALWPRMQQQRWIALAVALAAWVLLLLYSARYTTADAVPELMRQGRHVAFAAMQWCALVAAVGFARRHLDRDHRWRRTLSEAVFPVYILHQTITIVLAASLRPLHWAPALEGPLLVAATFGLSYAGYLLVRRVALLRPWFGLAVEEGARESRLAVPQARG